MNTTSHFHTTAETTGLRQCTDPRCGAWTVDGRNWALSPATLAFEQPAYPTGAVEDARRVVMPGMTITLEQIFQAA